MPIIIGVGIQTMRLIIGPTNRGCPPTTPIGGRTHLVIVMRTHWNWSTPNTSVQRGLGGVPPQMELVYA